ncbi:MAG: putative thiol oxidoreductase [bacterium]|nr:putative thiol oxidoreductase [bacterium]
MALALAACSSAPSDPTAALLGGDTTIFDVTDEAFNYPAHNLDDASRALFQLGDGVFNRNWITAPATPQGNDGLGPTFNALSCSGCHPNNGRGAPPESSDAPFFGLLLRLAVDGTDAHGGPNPDPSYGDQLQNRSIAGVPVEGTPSVTYTEMPGAYADGEPYSLRAPSYTVTALAFGPFPTGEMISPRVAPQLVGAGLLQAVPEDTIRRLAAGNGGRVNEVWDTAHGATVLGRFGWKANQPTVEQQIYAAFRGDIGITSSLYPTKNCPPPQSACAAALPSLSQPNLGALEASAMVVHGMALAVPAARDVDAPEVRRGATLFVQAGCASCHVTELRTGVVDGYPALSNQTIRPYTDLSLHDMGAALADGRPDFLASGSEWRTPPLWGLGLLPAVNDHQLLLHDGRARGFAEAILWHDGEAATTKQAFHDMPKRDRDALIAFLQSR